MYATQSFQANAVLTAAQMNQMMENVAQVRVSHIGSATPPELADGLKWLNTRQASAGYWELSTFVGSSFIPEGRFYTQSNHWIPTRAGSLLGTAANRNVGVTPGDVVQLTTVGGSAALPGLDGSLLTGRLQPLTGNGLQTITASSVVNIDATDGDVVRLLHSVGIGSLTITNPATVCELWVLREALTGVAPALVWPTNITWKDGAAPTLSDGLGAVDVVRLLTRDAGTFWFGDYVTGTTLGAGTYLYDFGDNHYSELGDNTTTNRTSLTRVGSSVSGWDRVVFGSVNSDTAGVGSAAVFAFALTASGALYATGANSFGQLGLGDRTQRSVWTQVGSAQWVDINPTFFKYSPGPTWAIRNDGTLWFAGMFEVFSGVPIGSLGFSQVGTLATWAALAGADDLIDINVYALDTSGVVKKVTIAGTDTPVVSYANWPFVNSATTAALLALGGSNLQGAYTPTWMYINSAGQLFGKGSNLSGQLATGINSPSTVDSWTMIGTGQVFVEVVVAPGRSGNHHVMAIDDGQNLWAWGGNLSGQHGSGVNSDAYVPTRVGCAHTWAAVAAGYGFTLALTTEGELFAAGTRSPLTAAASYGFVQVGSFTTWRSIAAGWHHGAGSVD